MALPRVSVLIPCYNAERTIGATLESVRAQTWPNVETIVVDDGSTDASATVVESFVSPTLRLERQANRGQTAALNACLRYAQGDYIQYLDADDLIAPEKIARQVERLMRAPDCIASCEWSRFRSSAAEARFEPESVWRDLPPLDWLAASRSDGLGMMFPAMWLVPRTIVDKVGPWREDLTLNNDAEYFTRALLQCRAILFCSGARCFYRSGDKASFSGRKTLSAWRSQFEALSLCEAYVRRREDSDRMRRGFALSWQHLAHASYPYAPALAEEALVRSTGLHPVKIEPDGGRLFHVAARLLGWRRARRLQVATGRA